MSTEMSQNSSAELKSSIPIVGDNASTDMEASCNDSSDPLPLKPHKALLRRFVTLSDAEEDEDDMRPKLLNAQQGGTFYEELKARSGEIKSVVASHCGLTNPDLVHLSPIYDDTRIFWQHGSFNVCIPVTVEQPGKSRSAKMAFRVPLPYKVGEHHYPGNCEEKLRSEAATYVWINKNCPEVPTAASRGFGVPGGMGFYDQPQEAVVASPLLLWGGEAVVYEKYSFPIHGNDAGYTIVQG